MAEPLVKIHIFTLYFNYKIELFLEKNGIFNLNQLHGTPVLNIKKCLNDCISDPSDVEKIMDYIKEKRDFRYIKDIKRQYSKNT